jgi:dihydrofolate synthase/folylpolyglutamate synthase
VKLPGRFQVIPGPTEWILDVAHNAEAAQSLAASLAARRHSGRTIAVCGILSSKDIAGIVAALAREIDRWIAVGLEGPRALPPAELARRIGAAGAASVVSVADVASGMAQARAECGPEDRVVVFGSFLTVGPALDWLDRES